MVCLESLLPWCGRNHWLLWCRLAGLTRASGCEVRLDARHLVRSLRGGGRCPTVITGSHCVAAGPRHGPAAVDRRIHRTVVASKPGLDKRGMRWMKVALRA